MTEVHDGVNIQPGNEVEFVVVQNQRNGKYSACSVRKITYVKSFLIKKKTVFCVCLYLLLCIYPLKVQAHCLRHTCQLSGCLSRTVDFVSFLVNEREEGVVALYLAIGPLKTCSALKPTYNKWQSILG